MFFSCFQITSENDTSTHYEDEMVQVLTEVVPAAELAAPSPVPPLLPSSVVLPTTTAMSQDSQHPALDKTLANNSHIVCPDTSTLVSNSSLNASVQSFVPQTQQPTPVQAYPTVPYYVGYVHQDMPSEMVPHSYLAGESFITETNTSVPPPISYDASLPINYYQHYPVAHTYLQMTHAQANPSIYQLPPHLTYPMHPQPEYYGNEGECPHCIYIYIYVHTHNLTINSMFHLHVDFLFVFYNAFCSLF